MRTFNFCPERQFFGGGGSVPAVQQPPAPQPTPTPTNINPVANANDRAATLKKLNYGLASTVAGGAPGAPVGASLTPMAAVGTGTAKTSGGT
jgi:hypothetical protein